MWTNVLFDLLLTSLMRIADPQLAQRLAACLSLLIFFWGAFSFIAALSRQVPWPICPLLAMFSYGVVFQQGFFNYYLGLGFAFLGLAVCLRTTAHGYLRSLPLWALAAASHLFSAALGLAILAFAQLAVRLPRTRRWRLLVAASAISALAAGALSCYLRLGYEGSGAEAFGLLQLWIYDHKYVFFVVAAGVTIFAPILHYVSLAIDPVECLGELPPILYFFCCLLVIFAPSNLVIPGMAQRFTVIAVRLSLPAAILLLAWLAVLAPGRIYQGITAVLSVAFFTTLYFDQGRFSDFEWRLTVAVRDLPRGTRLATRFQFPTRVDVAEHMIDRACIGHCWSYLNFEPASAAFRVRVTDPGRTAISSTSHLQELRDGQAPLSPTESPLLLLQPSSEIDGGFVTIPLHAGEMLPQLEMIRQ
jgi:hypothetical protein